MSTGKIIAIVAVVVLLFMGIIGACLYSSADSPEASPTKITLTASQRLQALEQQNADLARQLQTVSQTNTDLQKQITEANSRISSLERLIEQMERNR